MAVERYTSIQVVRAAAALMVVALHSETVTNKLAGSAPQVPDWANFGFAGVDLFFVVSGFIISMVAAGTGLRAGDFLLKRGLRILPFYWAFTGLWLAALASVHLAPPSLPFLVASLAGWPLRSLPLLGVGWSLEHEFLFYLLVAALLAVGRLRWTAAVLAVLLAVGVLDHVVLQQATGRDVWDWHLCSLFQFDFLGGVLLYRYRRVLGRLDGRLLLVAGMAAFPVASVLTRSGYPAGHVETNALGVAGLVRVTSFGIASILIVGGAVSLEQRRPALLDSLPGRALQAVGDASFALYLLHPHVLEGLGVLCAKAHLTTAVVWPVRLGAIAVATAAACVWYRLIEAPYLRTMARWRRGAPRPAVAI